MTILTLEAEFKKRYELRIYRFPSNKFQNGNGKYTSKKLYLKTCIILWNIIIFLFFFFSFFFFNFVTKNYHFYSNKFQIEKMQILDIFLRILQLKVCILFWNRGHFFLFFFFLICITKLLLTTLFFPRIN